MAPLSRTMAIVLVGSLLTAASTVRASEPSVARRTQEIRADLADQLELRILDSSELERHRARLTEAVDHLEQFLQTAEPEIAAGWQDYLMWSELRGQLLRDEADTEVLREVLLRFRRNVTGLNMDAFRAVRSALVDYIHTVDIVGAMSTARQVDICIDRLAGSLANYEQQPNYSDAYNIGRELYCIERSTTGNREALQAIRERFRHPNAYGRVSLRLLNRMLARDVSDETVINEASDGKHTRGTATTKAQLKAELVAAADHAIIDIHLAGTTQAPSTVTRQRGVTVYGSFLTNVDAHKHILMDKNGLSFRPAQATCSTNVRIHSVVADRRMVERIAQRRAPRLTSEAESQVSRSTEQRIERQIDEQAETALAEANSIFVNYFCVPNYCYGAFPELMQFSTTSENLQLHVRSAKPWHLASPELPPALDPKHDLCFAIHESMLGNYAESVFGGKQLTDRQWLRMMNVMTGSEPRALWVHDRTDRWSLTFADRRPIALTFDQNTFRVTVRSKQIARGSRRLDRLIDITASFHIKISRDGPVLFREGKVSVGFVDDGAIDSEQQDMLEFVHWKFNAIMPRALYADGLVPPTGGSLGMLRKLLPKEYSFSGGWMKIGYQLADDEDDLRR